MDWIFRFYFKKKNTFKNTKRNKDLSKYSIKAEYKTLLVLAKNKNPIARSQKVIEVKAVYLFLVITFWVAIAIDIAMSQSATCGVGGHLSTML